MCAGLYWVFNRNMMWHLFIGGVKKALYASSWPKVFGWIRKLPRTFLYSPNEEENCPQSHSSFPLHWVFSLYFLSQTKHQWEYFFFLPPIFGSLHLLDLRTWSASSRSPFFSYAVLIICVNSLFIYWLVLGGT